MWPASTPPAPRTGSTPPSRRRKRGSAPRRAGTPGNAASGGLDTATLVRPERHGHADVPGAHEREGAGTVGPPCGGPSEIGRVSGIQGLAGPGPGPRPRGAGAAGQELGADGGEVDELSGEQRAPLGLNAQATLLATEANRRGPPRPGLGSLVDVSVVHPGSLPFVAVWLRFVRISVAGGDVVGERGVGYGPGSTAAETALTCLFSASRPPRLRVAAALR
jgi:hypothetical protein